MQLSTRPPKSISKSLKSKALAAPGEIERAKFERQRNEMQNAKEGEEMPQNVRNFWLECEVDGRRETVACGPKAKDGGLRLKLKVRHKGEVHEALYLTACTGRGAPEELHITGYFPGGNGRVTGLCFPFPR